jgi:cytochrome c biogenesis DsbD-like protein
MAGYLVFATVVWFLGVTLARIWGGRLWIVGGVQILLAAALLTYAAGWPHPRCLARRHTSGLVQLGPAPLPKSSGALLLGFLTGINLCPPFLVAGLRAAQLGSLQGALLFFVFFFFGTAVWFAPFLSLSFVRRSSEFVLVARVAAILLACWYGFSGVFTLIERTVYG